VENNGKPAPSSPRPTSFPKSATKRTTKFQTPSW
jgi:hypothetical protein